MTRSIGIVAFFTSAFAVLAACSSSTASTSAPSDGGGPSAKGLIGDPCPNGVADCTTGLKCATEDPGGGQCFQTCTPSKDADCGDTTKYACSSEGHCYLKCTGVSDCKRAGYACKDDAPPRGVKFCDVP